MDANGYRLREGTSGAGQGRDGGQTEGEERKDVPQGEKSGTKSKEKAQVHEGREEWENRGCYS